MSRPHIPTSLRRQLREECRNRCGYCLTPALYTAQQLVPDHLIPVSLGGATIIENLWLACRHCNECKNNRIVAIDPISKEEVSIFNPRTQSWLLHFVWNDDGTEICGITATGRTTVDALNMNNEAVVTSRSFWVRAGWHPPED